MGSSHRGRAVPGSGPRRAERHDAGTRAGVPGEGGRPAASPDLEAILRLQRTAGNRAVRDLLAAPAGPASAPYAAVQRRPSARDRRRRERATRLRAADARTLLAARLPRVVATMSAEQLAQVQRVLDAAVVNPEVQGEADDIYRKSVTAQSGNLVVRDQRMVRKAERTLEDLVPVRESDKRIRLDADALLATDALTPRTDNPDERAYLGRIRETLRGRGVWLRLAPKMVKDPEDPSRRIVDPRDFEAFLSLGPDGDTIPTTTGELTRDAILGTTMLGAGYYRQVDNGPIQAAIDREARRLRAQITAGLAEHERLRKVRASAPFGVAEVSDLLGGADFPDASIWDDPHRLLVRALGFNVGGDVAAAQAFLVVAAMTTRNAAWTLAEYVDATTSGAGRALTALKIAKTAGHVAQAGLALTGVAGLVRGAGRLAVGEAGAAAVDKETVSFVEQYVAREGHAAEELASVRFAKSPPGSTGGFVKAKHSYGAGEGFHKY